jgi:5-methylthioribose kinase
VPFVLDLARPSELRNFLRARGLLAADRQLARLERAGDGAMNLTLRARFDDGRSLIVRQSRGRVERRPEVPAPEARILSEIAFYRAVAVEPVLARRLPGLVYYSARDRIACLEDLGEAGDLTGMHRGEPLPATCEQELLAWLRGVHALPLDANDWGEVLQNRAMRAFHHALAFEAPFSGDGCADLDARTPGLAQGARRLRNDLALRARARDLGNRYLARGPHLLHGDFWPGNWLRHARGIRVVDAELACFGAAEYDVGVYLAHRLLAGATRDDIATAIATYAPPPGFEHATALGFAGIEMLRRLLGAAPLWLDGSLARQLELLATGRDLVLAA